VTSGAYWNSVAEGWVAGRDRLWRAHSDAVNVALCRRWLPVGRSRRLLKTDLFDEAAGDGLWPALVTLARHVDAVDVSLAVARRARTQHPIAGAAADVRHLPFPDASFDTVVSNSTLDHFDSREAIAESLAELRRVLAPGGHLLLTLDNGANPIVALRNALPERWLSSIGLVSYRVGRTLGPRGARRLLADVGFHVVRQTAIMHAPRVAAIPLLRFVDRMSGGRAAVRCLRALGSFEIAERWPTRDVTGHFVALLATTPASTSPPRTG
jgi:SAM-dependent methyltransferase